MKMNPLEQSKFIKNKFSEFIKSTFQLKDKKYNDDFIEQLNKSTLTKGPYLKLELPFSKSFTLNELIVKDVLCNSFKSLGNTNFDRTLYWHQNEALIKVINGDNIVVSTGTGSGKTEAFLYPIINQILRKIEKKGKIEGIQAILLYPMNALVNDQLERLRTMLKDTPDISFGYFTGDTPEFYKDNFKKRCDRLQYIEENFKGETKPPKNERLTREEIREKVPNILITNFSMLEYLLVRPKDNMIINKHTLHDWSFMVLDEAHSYRGTQAIEISHLLKRIQVLTSKKPQFILTSATLGSNESDKPAIVEFSNKLTSATFNNDGVIFAKRIMLSDYDNLYKVKPKDYTKLLLKLKNKEDINEILLKYSANNLFDLLIHDDNVIKLGNILNKTDTFDNVYNKFNNNVVNIDINDFINLIDLITMARNQDNQNIYDVKYHFFVRTLEGAFISLGHNPKLELTNRRTIDGKWAFEIALCKTCNSMYIIGKEHENKIYRNELELDENYSFFDDLDTDFYLVKEEVKDEIESDEDLEVMIVCSICGNIYSKNQLMPSKCKCGEDHLVELYKVIGRSASETNNLRECRVCGKRSNRIGIIESFKLYKDQSTALLSQILLESMEDLGNKERLNVQEIDFNPFAKPINTNINKYEEFKQFLAFSDSRQQASFYALFFQRNQDKFLRKALIIKENDNQNIETLITKIEKTIENKKLFQDQEKNELSSTKQAYITLLLELFKIDGVNSLEGLGVILFKPDFSKIIESISSEMLFEYLPKVKISDLDSLLSIVTDIFRTVPAISHSDVSGLNREEREEYLGYRSFENYVRLRVPTGQSKSYVKSLLPVRENGTNNLINYFIKAYDISVNEAKSYIEKLWNVLKNLDILSASPDDENLHQIKLSKYIVKNYKEVKWYQCDRCKTITAYNINNICIKGSCSGKLIDCNPDEVLKDNYYRNEYLSKKIEPIIVQEHTGQLTRAQGKKYQNLFMNKKINVLSSSTTFEMGIDIGSLDTVFMRNIPPTNANYAQRAGRAGRSDDSVAFILTYADHNSHDQLYFNDPIPMIDGQVKPPYFKLDNKKITIRHIYAHIIGMFYRSYSGIDTKLSDFLNEDYALIQSFVNINKSKIERMLPSFINSLSLPYFDNYKWFDMMFKNDSMLFTAVNNIKSDINELNIAIKHAADNENYRDARNFKDELNNLKNTEIVQSLLRYNVLPGYGFPINVVPLRIYERSSGRYDKNINAQRDLSIALSEYAPDSEIIVDKKKYTSRYIITPEEGKLSRTFYYTCKNENCEAIKMSHYNIEHYLCEACGGKTSENEFIEPLYGFVNDDENKKSSYLKPRKTYSSNIRYLGSIEPYNPDLNAKNIVLIQQAPDDKLLITNDNAFFYCDVCGYSELNNAKASLKYYDRVHNTFRGNSCHNVKLVQTGLGHIIITDVIKIRININMSYEEAYSTLTAIINGITEHLQIDRNDIDGVLVKEKEDNRFAFILFDTTYGGAGNVKQLIKLDGLIETLKVAKKTVDNDCCAEDVSCPKCLRNYRNRSFHKYLVRGLAKNMLEEIIFALLEEH